MRRRYKWHIMKNQESKEQEKIKDAVKVAQWKIPLRKWQRLIQSHLVM